jgi:hypothetical protein
VRNKFVLAILAVFVQAIFAQGLAPAVTAPAALASEPALPAADSALVPGEAAASDSSVVAEPDSTAAPVVAEPEPAPVAEPEPPPAPVAPPVAAKEPFSFNFNLNMTYKFGVRAGIGMSHFRNHEYLRMEDPNSGNSSSAVVNSTIGVKMYPAFGFSAGIISDIGLTDTGIFSMFSIAPELQYSLYRSNQKVLRNKPKTREEVHNYGVYLHVFEIPVLFRWNFSRVYADIGPQLGFNLFSNIYKDANYYKPDLNLLAFGLTGGAGMNIMGKTRVDIRGHFGFLDYAKDVNGGNPWSIQAGVSRFLF